MDSLINTLYHDFEIIVVDNGSSDQSVEYLKQRSSSIQVIELKENKGFAEGANAGAKQATGRILAFVNNDMEFQPDWLINAVRILVSNKSAAAVQSKILVYGNREEIDSIGLSVDRFNIVLPIGRHEIDRGQYDNLREIGACSGGAMIIWKNIFQDIGDFDPTYFMYYEDVDLSWRVRLKGFRILPAQSSVVYHFGSATSRISSIPTEWDVPPFFAFHTTKNYIYCWLKNSSSKILFLYWPVVLFVVIIKIFFELLNGRVPAALSQAKGIVWNLTHLKLIAKERSEIRKIRMVKSDDVLLATTIHRHSHLLAWMRNGLQIAKEMNRKNSSK